MRVFAGVDGGATRTRVRAVDAAATLLGEGSAGPGSLTAGADLAAANVLAALEEAMAGRDIPLDEVTAVAGLAGHRQEARRASFEAALTGLRRLEVISDGYAALLGAHAGQAGAIVIVGTGSVALRLDADGLCRQAGGWGPVGGDEGSGNWLGRLAAKEALRAADEAALEGRPITPFLAKILESMGGEHGRILDWLADASAARFAEFAPLLFQHAGKDDPVATALVGRAAREVERLIRLIGDRGRVPVALMGGLAPALLPWLDEAVREAMSEPAGTALDGALLRARGLAPPEVYA